MLASYFVVNGVKALKEPEAYVEETQPFTDAVVPLAKGSVPQLPESATTWAMIRGGLQVVGSAALVTGKGRRLGAVLLGASLVPNLFANNPLTGDTAEERDQNRNDFLRNLALLGGTMVAAGDLQGRPGIGYRAAKRKEQIEKAADQRAKQAKKKANKASKKVSKAVNS